jgi:hypothetical protein
VVVDAAPAGGATTSAAGADPRSGGANLLGRDGTEGDEDGEHEELLHAG